MNVLQVFRGRSLNVAVLFMSCLLMTHGAWIKVKCRSDERKTAAAPPWATSRETRTRGDKSIDGPGLNRYMDI